MTCLIVIALLGLSACGSEETADAQTSGQSSNASPAPDGKGNESGDDEKANAETDRASSPTGCLVGTWLADNSQLGAMFKGAADAAGAGGSVSDPTGKVLMTLGPAGEYAVNYDAWTMEISQQDITMKMIREGTDQGSYEASDDGTLSTSEATMGSVVTLESPGGAHQIGGEPSAASGQFNCQGETLEISAQGSTTVFHRQ